MILQANSLPATSDLMALSDDYIPKKRTLKDINVFLPLDEPKNGTHKKFYALKMLNICQQNVSKQL